MTPVDPQSTACEREARASMAASRTASSDAPSVVPTTGAEGAPTVVSIVIYFLRRSLTAAAALAALAAVCCADNRAPSRDVDCPEFSVEGDTYVVVGTRIEFRISGAEDVDLSLQLSPVPPSGRLPATTARHEEGAHFVEWLPASNDATEAGHETYTLTVGVAGEMCGATATHRFDVVHDLGRFVDPAGDTVQLSLSESPCIDALPVRVRADLLAEDDVSISVLPSLPARATLLPAGPGKSKVFSWCPPSPANDAVDGHHLILVAEGPHGEFARQPFGIFVSP